MGATPNEADRCPLCATDAKIVEIPATRMERCECPVCGPFTYSTDLFRRVRELHPDHWIKTKLDLSSALKKGVVKPPLFESEQDIMKAIGGLNRTEVK